MFNCSRWFASYGWSTSAGTRKHTLLCSERSIVSDMIQSERLNFLLDLDLGSHVRAAHASSS